MTIPLPSKVCVGPEQWFDVEEGALSGELGHVDFGTGTVRIEAGQSDTEKHMILLHEMIHIADEKARDGDFYKRKLTEAQVVALAGSLWPMLAASGLLAGVEESDIAEIMTP